MSVGWWSWWSRKTSNGDGGNPESSGGGVGQLKDRWVLGPVSCIYYNFISKTGAQDCHHQKLHITVELPWEFPCSYPCLPCQVLSCSLLLSRLLQLFVSCSYSYYCCSISSSLPGFLLPGFGSSTASYCMIVQVVVVGGTSRPLVYRSVILTCTNLGMYHSVWLFSSSIGTLISTSSSCPCTFNLTLITSSFPSNALFILIASLEVFSWHSCLSKLSLSGSLLDSLWAELFVFNKKPVTVKLDIRSGYGMIAILIFDINQRWSVGHK